MIRSNLWSRLIPQDSMRELSLRIPTRVKEIAFALPMGLALGILLSKVLTTMTTPSVMAVLGSLPPTILWGLAIAAIGMLLVIILRQYELAAVIVVAIKLYVDWYLNLTFMAPTLALGLLLIFFLGRSPQYPWAAPRVLWLWVLFLLLTILETNRAPSILYGVQYYVDNIFSALVMFWLGIVVARDIVHVRNFFQLLSVFGALIALHTIIEAVTGTFLFESSRSAADVAATSYLGASARAVHRATSFFMYTNSDGAFLALMFFIPLALFFMTRLSIAWKVLFIIEMILTLMAMVFTYSTGAWSSLLLGFVVFIVLVGRMRYRIQLVALFLIVVAIAVVAFPEQFSLLLQHSSDPGELALRQAVWLTALRVIEAYPLTGLGIGRDVYLQGYQPFRVSGEYDVVNHPHDSYLEFTALGGIPVGIMFIALLVVAFWLSWRNWQHMKVEYRPLLAGGIAAAIALCWYSLSDAGWTVGPLLTVAWIILGTVSSPLLLKKKTAPAPVQSLEQADDSSYIPVGASWMDKVRQGSLYE
jgi:O-antigen ligase